MRKYVLKGENEEKVLVDSFKAKGRRDRKKEQKHYTHASLH